MAAAKIANLDHRGDRKTDQTANLQFEVAPHPVTQADAARMLNVSDRSVRAERLDDHPERGNDAEPEDCT